jgi:ABC-type Zn uptake system ZnuABC Zn-binding protein ZnuA
MRMASARRCVPLVLLALVGACAAQDRRAAARRDRLQVVTTVAPITSIASNVIGDRADIDGVVPEGVDSHTCEPPPSVAEKLSAADVIYINGLELEAPTKALAEENKSDDAQLIELGNETISPDEYIYDFSFPREDGKPNPHLWTHPLLARRYAEIIKDAMVERDRENAVYYERNYASFARLVDELDRAMRASFATMPKEGRKLLTYHDAYAYFAKDYDWDVIGAIQLSNFQDPTPKDVAQLVSQVKKEKVPAIFGSEVFPSSVLEQIGRETGVRYVDVLRDDDLPGRPGETDHSWLGLVRFDYTTMVEALGGDASALRRVRVRNVAPDEASYPQ